VIALIALGALSSVAIGAGPAAWPARPCPGDRASLAAATQTGGATGLADLRGAVWYRIDPRLDRSGVLQGQRLAFGTDGARASRALDLPPESFAAGPFGRLVLIGRDDGVMSRLAAVDVAAGCTFDLAAESDVIRRATIDAAAATIYEMRVDRTTRADLGIWSRPFDGSRPATRVLDPIDPDERFGPTFTTEFAWDAAGHRLAIQSCGEAACRVRVLDTTSGLVRLVGDPDLGTLVALDNDRLVTYQACPGWPCPIVAIDVDTGQRQVLADAAAASVVVSTTDGPRLVHEVLDASGVGLRSVALDGSVSNDLGRLPDGLRLEGSPLATDTATRVPDGWVLVTPDGRLSAAGPEPQTELRHVPDGASVQLQEVSR
jgi:hypothetical protein